DRRRRDGLRREGQRLTSPHVAERGGNVGAVGRNERSAYAVVRLSALDVRLHDVVASRLAALDRRMNVVDRRFLDLEFGMRRPGHHPGEQNGLDDCTKRISVFGSHGRILRLRQSTAAAAAETRSLRRGAAAVPYPAPTRNR